MNGAGRLPQCRAAAAVNHSVLELCDLATPPILFCMRRCQASVQMAAATRCWSTCCERWNRCGRVLGTAGQCVAEAPGDSWLQMHDAAWQCVAGRGTKRQPAGDAWCHMVPHGSGAATWAACRRSTTPVSHQCSATTTTTTPCRRCTAASGGTPAPTKTPSFPRSCRPWCCRPSPTMRWACWGCAAPWHPDPAASPGCAPDALHRSAACSPRACWLHGA